MRAQPIPRKRLGDRVYEILEARIREGQHEPGAHLGEALICDALKVSRTPVREALFKLAQDGLVESRPNQGFFVAPTSRRRVAEAYPVLGALEALAVESTTRFEDEVLDRLERINQSMTAPRVSARERFEGDLQFHALLTGCSGNQTLERLIDSAKREINRWDGGRERGLADPARAEAEHRAILKHLQAGDHASAARLLRDHWKSGIDTVHQWMDGTETADA